jgi:hypothetical protein
LLDAALQIVVKPLDFRLRLLEFGSLHDLPFFIPAREGKLVRVHHVEDLRRAGLAVTGHQPT